jgi:hypothetical protein
MTIMAKLRTWKANCAPRGTATISQAASPCPSHLSLIVPKSLEGLELTLDRLHPAPGRVPRRRRRLRTNTPTSVERQPHCACTLPTSGSDVDQGVLFHRTIQAPPCGPRKGVLGELCSARFGGRSRPSDGVSLGHGQPGDPPGSGEAPGGCVSGQRGPASAHPLAPWDDRAVSVSGERVVWRHEMSNGLRRVQHCVSVQQ